MQNRKSKLLFIFVMIIIIIALVRHCNGENKVMIGNQEASKDVAENLTSYLQKFPTVVRIPGDYVGPVSSDIGVDFKMDNQILYVDLLVTPVKPTIIRTAGKAVKGDVVTRDPTFQEIESFCKNNPACIEKEFIKAEVTDMDIEIYCNANPKKCEVPVFKYEARAPTADEIKAFCNANPKRCEVPVVKYKPRAPRNSEIKAYCNMHPEDCKNESMVSMAPVMSSEETREGCAYKSYVKLITNSKVYAIRYIYPKLDKRVSTLALEDKGSADSKSAQISCAVPNQKLLVNLITQNGDLIVKKDGKFQYSGSFSALLVNGHQIKMTTKPVVYEGKPYLEILIPE